MLQRKPAFGVVLIYVQHLLDRHAERRAEQEAVVVRIIESNGEDAVGRGSRDQEREVTEPWLIVGVAFAWVDVERDGAEDLGGKASDGGGGREHATGKIIRWSMFFYSKRFISCSKRQILKRQNIFRTILWSTV